MSVLRAAHLDRMLRPVHRWVWSDFDRRVRKLLTFAEVETDGGRDILRAAEVTPDPLLRRLYLEHAIDELRHGDMFRQRGAALLAARPARSSGLFSGTPLPGGHGLDDLRIDGEPDQRLLAFLHVAEKAAAGRFAIYREVVDDDPSTRAIFEEILRDEVFHMNYTYTQLARISPQSYRWQVWRARASRLWKRYLRVAAALAGVIGAVVLTIHVFHPAAAVCVAGQARRTARAVGLGTPITGDTRRRADQPVLDDEDSRDLRALPRLGGRARHRRRARLRRAGGATVAPEERRRLSRWRHRMVPGSRAASRPADLDAVVFYERSMLKFERILTCALRAFPALVAIVSARDQELARRKGLGARHHLVAPRRARAEDPVHRTPRVARGRRVSHSADASRGHPDGGRRRRMGDADGRPRRAARGRHDRDHAAARDPLPAFARHAVFDVHRVSRLRRERGRVQGDGPGRLRTSDAGRRRCAS